jgi:catechol 2,3-dioxygenase-like lactoylglutathione lyase family enzyme
MNDTTTTELRSLASGINHAAIVTVDADRLASFYVRVFDAWTVEVPSPPGTRSMMVQFTSSCGLALMEVPDSPHASATTEMLARGHVDHFGIDAPSAAVLEQLRVRLMDEGATDGMISDYGPMLSVYFEDPDGMACEVCWIRDPAFAGPHAPEVFTGSLLDL